MALVIIDGVAPSGHVNINRYYFATLARWTTAIWLGESTAERYADIPNTVIFDDQAYAKSCRIWRSYVFSAASIRVLRGCRRGDKVLFLSYDLSSFWLVCLAAKILGVRVVAFNHNTAPGTSSLRSTLHKMCIGNVVHLCYTPDITAQFVDIGLDAHYVGHPVLSPSENGVESKMTSKRGFQWLVFCPSARCDMKKINEMAARYETILFVAKGTPERQDRNLVVREYFDDYGALMRSCDFLYLPLDDEARVPGPFYEAVACGKPTILNRTAFRKYAIDVFAHLAVKDESDWLRVSQSERPFDVQAYNDSVRAELQRLLAPNHEDESEGDNL